MTIFNLGPRRQAAHLKILSLTASGLLALWLAIAFPASPDGAVSWRDRDYAIYYHAHQLFRCDPEELSESQLHDVERWCRCLRLTSQAQTSGVHSLTDDECQFVPQVLDELCTDTKQFAGYRPIYELCAQSLARRRSAIASKHEPPSRDRFAAGPDEVRAPGSWPEHDECHNQTAEDSVLAFHWVVLTSLAQVDHGETQVKGGLPPCHAQESAACGFYLDDDRQRWLNAGPAALDLDQCRQRGRDPPRDTNAPSGSAASKETKAPAGSAADERPGK